MTTCSSLEQRLAASTAPLPPHLRARTLAAVQDELARQRSTHQGAWWIGLAAALLIGLNLAMMAPQLSNPPELYAAAVNAPSAADIRQLLPELSPSQARQLAGSLALRTQLIPLPDLPAGRHLSSYQGD